MLIQFVYGATAAVIDEDVGPSHPSLTSAVIAD
jgi:hypothetical protein